MKRKGVWSYKEQVTVTLKVTVTCIRLLHWKQETLFFQIFDDDAGIVFRC